MNCMGLRMTYGCCLYLKCVTKNNFISISLATSNSRVAPYRNKITLPILELLGNLIFSRLILTILNSLKKQLIFQVYIRGPIQKFLWLGLNRIINRFVEIRKRAPSEKWNLCSTKVNQPI